MPTSLGSSTEKRLSKEGEELSDYIYTSDGELYHYGVLGMKWGVRRSNYKTSQQKKLSAEELAGAYAFVKDLRI